LGFSRLVQKYSECPHEPYAEKVKRHQKITELITVQMTSRALKERSKMKQMAAVKPERIALHMQTTAVNLTELGLNSCRIEFPTLSPRRSAKNPITAPHKHHRDSSAIRKIARVTVTCGSREASDLRERAAATSHNMKNQTTRFRWRIALSSSRIAAAMFSFERFSRFRRLCPSSSSACIHRLCSSASADR
jgi:hypothetical protein